MKVPRIVISAPKSGSGKTLVSVSMMKAFSLLGKKVSAFKCGPDYIDPMFHKKILKVPSKNLDLFFTDENATKNIFLSGNSAEISVIEGVMGLYDGLGGTEEAASTYALARALKSPVILVIDARGMARSVLAEIAGFLSMDTEKLIRGVILNNISPSLFRTLRPLIEKNLPVKALGFFPHQDEIKIESRYLGLKLPDEIKSIEENVEKAAEKLRKSADLEEILRIAESAPEFEFSENLDEMKGERKTETLAGQKSAEIGQKIKADGINLVNQANQSIQTSLTSQPDLIIRTEKTDEKNVISANPQNSEKTRIAVAKDEAFCFYYDDNLRLLEKFGVEIVFFSPLRDARLPENVSGLILGGGYPEMFAEQLEKNEQMRNSVKNAVENGLPSLAECGGFIYLHKNLVDRNKKSFKMAGVIDADTFWAGKLVRFGYVSIREKNPLFLKKNPEIKGHEFHYFDSEKNGSDCEETKPVGGKKFEAGFTGENHWWGFAHLYYASNPEFAENFGEACRKWQEKN